MDNFYYYETEIGTIGLFESNEAITELCFGKKIYEIVISKNRI
ncbi:hypothetical protein CLORY_20260 [Clostridium oryzae]|uniref:Uncharacterized protein n=1 Tax=Clostridium oryzae TaxID=1450648 RepID=A0A1V4IQ50_9CLOT|nr:hypothetical protein CLORY_20260 [Clostridium oryzae]